MALSMWWFALIDAKGEIVYFEYRDKQSCEIIRNAYTLSTPTNKITTCMPKENSDRFQEKRNVLRYDIM